jgi:hypothetical protein
MNLDITVGFQVLAPVTMKSSIFLDRLLPLVVR